MNLTKQIYHASFKEATTSVKSLAIYLKFNSSIQKNKIASKNYKQLYLYTWTNKKNNEIIATWINKTLTLFHPYLERKV